MWEKLIEFMPYSPWLFGSLAFFIIIAYYWEKIKPFILDLKTFFSDYTNNLYVSKKINPAIRHSFCVCEKDEPILGAFREVIPVQIRIDKNREDIETKLERGKVIAIVPSKSLDGIVKAIDIHFSKNLAQSSIVRDCDKLERALELFGLDTVIKKTRLDGALKIAANRFVNNAKQDEEIRLMFDILTDLNFKLKQFEHLQDRRLLRIFIIEICRGEFNAVGKIFM